MRCEDPDGVQLFFFWISGIELYFVGLESAGLSDRSVPLSSTSCEEVLYVPGWQHELHGVYVFSECFFLLLNFFINKHVPLQNRNATC